MHGILAMMAVIAAAGGEESSHGDAKKNRFEILHFKQDLIVMKRNGYLDEQLFSY